METATSTLPRAADPTLDVLDGSRIAQVTVRLGETAIATHRIEPDRPASRTSTILRWGWAALALAPAAALVGWPGLTACLALLGLGCGLLGTLLRRAGHTKSALTIGPGGDLPLDSPSLHRFPLVTAGPDGPLLHLLPSMMEGELRIGWRRVPLRRLEPTHPSSVAPGARRFVIPGDARIELRLGQTTVEVASVAPARQLTGSSREASWREPLCAASSFAVHAAVVLAALLASPTKKTLPAEAVRKKLIRLSATWVPSFRGDPVPFHPSFVRARDPLIGNTRRPDAPPGLYALRGPLNNQDPHLARRLAEDRAGNAGVLGLLQRAGAGVGGHFPDLREQRPALPGRVAVGPMEIRGAMDREIIRRVVRRHLSEVRYCFIYDLQANPDLAGQASVGFVIGPDGQVRRSRIAASTLRHRGVETCLTRAARRWLFPRPRRGTVTVRVPYHFRALE